MRKWYRVIDKYGREYLKNGGVKIFYDKIDKDIEGRIQLICRGEDGDVIIAEFEEGEVIEGYGKGLP